MRGVLLLVHTAGRNFITMSGTFSASDMSPFFLALPERGDDGKSIFVREVPSKFTSSNIEVNSLHFLSNFCSLKRAKNNNHTNHLLFQKPLSGFLVARGDETKTVNYANAFALFCKL